MSGCTSFFTKFATLTAALLASSLLLAQQWKEIPVGYNMPKSAMAASPAPAPFPQAPKTASLTYSGEGRDPKRPWEIEFHAGGFWNLGGEGGGTAKILQPGDVFTSGLGPQSRNEPSYMFGDGTNLFNSAAAFSGLTNSIVPLDPILGHQAGFRNGGPAIGMRIGRDFGRWFQVELSADWNASPISLTDSSLLALENTRLSAGDCFQSLTTFFGGGSAYAVSNIRRSQGTQLFWTGAVNVNLKPEGKTVPYLTFGGGGISNLGPGPHLAILGAYNFSALGAPISEMDVVNIEVRAPRTQGVGLLGGGVRYYANSRWGLRLDVRDHVSTNSLNTILTATPIVATGSPAGSTFLPGNGTNNLIFSNDPSQGPSTLNTSIHGLKTFRPDGITNQLSATAGVFYKF